MDVKKIFKLRAGYQDLLIPFLSIITSLVIGAIIIYASGANVYAAYKGLWQGSFGNARTIAETFVSTTPYILTGLAVAFGFRCGLFNIGAEGQLYAGALAAAYIGYAWRGLPHFIHLPIAIIAGIIAGGIWGAIPGYLKAKTGAHEVINTIMMNHIMIRLTDYLVKNPMLDPKASVPRTAYILKSAYLPKIFPGFRLHWGFILAIIAIFLIYYILFKTKVGFEIRTVGLNQDAARYAGMNISKNFVLAMAISGGLAGLAGAGEVLGLNYNLPAAFVSGFGFDAIAIALLAKSNPFAVFPSAMLWAALRNGAGLMQVRAKISIDLVNIIQAFVIMFIAAPNIVRYLYRIRAEREKAGVLLTKGWGQ
ncbi:MAG: ABC transporter permease [Spirochaetota bacterium]|nr:MAG: ABC transporter permease [Spirochaetota bacterium]